MSTTPDVKYVLGADDTQASAAFDAIRTKAAASSAAIQGSFAQLKAPMDALHAKFLAIGAALAGAFAGIGKSVSDTAEMTEKAMDMGRALGVSTNEARAIQLALKDLGAEQGEFEGAAKGMVRQLAENEDKMQALGLKTRDAAGQLRPMNDLVLESIQVLGTYKEGTDRALASKVLFGRGIEASSKLMLYNKQVVDESRQAMQDLGLEVGENSVAAWKEFDAATDRAGFSVDGMKKAIGDALMPVATTLVEMFNAIMPAAIVVVRGAIGGLTTAFIGLREGIRIVWETFNAFVVSVTEPLRALGTAFYKLVTGDFKGAAEEMRNIPQVISKSWADAFANMTAGAVRAQEQISRIFMPDTATGSGGGAGKGTRNAPAKEEKPDKAKKEAKEKQEHEQSAMATYEATLDQQRIAYARENDLREMNKAQELAYWQDILATYEVGSKDRTAIVLKMSKLELEVLREQRKQKNAIAALQADDWKAETLDYIAELDARAAFEASQGNITQAQYIERRAAFNQMRLQAELEFIQKKIEIAQLDPENNLVALEQLEMAKLEIRRKYAALAGDISRQQIAEQQGPFQRMAESIGQAFNSLTTKLLTDWRNVGSALRGVLSSIGQSIIQEVVLKPLQAKIVAFAKERLLALAGIGTDAAKAGAGAASSQASIPVVGPYLALAAMGAILAAVGGMAGKVPSAAGGFSIPRGMNPLTQLHEEEMVLPKAYADVIRGLAQPGAGEGAAVAASQPAAGVIRGMPAEEFFMVNRADLAKALQASGRDFFISRR